MAKKLKKFLILLDNENLLYFPGSFLTGKVLLELEDETPALGSCNVRRNAKNAQCKARSGSPLARENGFQRRATGCNLQLSQRSWN